MQFLLTFGEGEGGKSKKLRLYYVKREGSIESQQKFDFFCYDFTPYHLTTLFQIDANNNFVTLEGY